jgi:hypothetical protein
MLNITVEQTLGSKASLSPASIKRSWMEDTPERHAYRCFPVTQANMVGWNISFTEDIEFVWNGLVDTTDTNVVLINGNDFAYTGRGQASVSLNTGLVFHTEENISMLAITPVNYFNKDFEVISSLISTSFYDNPIPLAIRGKIPNKNILIKAGEPVATLIPLSLGAMNNTEINIVEYQDPDNKRRDASKSYGEGSQKVNLLGKWTDWYRDAVNEKGESLGKHEVKALHLSVKNNINNKEGNGTISI